METCGRTEILLAHFIHIMYGLLHQAYCMEMRNIAVDNDNTVCAASYFEAILYHLFYNGVAYHRCSYMCHMQCQGV